MHRLTFSLTASLVALAVAAPVLAAPGRSPRQRGTSAPATVQQQPPPPELPPGDKPITARQVQLWFDAFTVMQAQDALQLSEAQYGKFVTRLRGLQETRTSHLLAHQKIINDLRKLTNPQTGNNDEALITERLKALRDEDDRAATDLHKAYEGVDETLDVRQQARFRIFEDRMEQQKLELLMRARQNARAAARGKRGGGL
jgi:hypothetical protein